MIETAAIAANRNNEHDEAERAKAALSEERARADMAEAAVRDRERQLEEVQQKLNEADFAKADLQDEVAHA